MLVSSFAMMMAGFTFGMVHALDADHVMAVSALSTRKPGFLKTIKFCTNWALGHGGMLLVVGALFFGLGYQIPEGLQRLAEASVGVLLIIIGMFCFWRIYKQNLHLQHHRHGDLVHIHWHKDGHKDQLDKNEDRASHAPMMVGMLHGLAGSAPALALVPILSQGQQSSAEQFLFVAAYLLVFSLGVLISMSLFGLGLGFAQKKLASFNNKLFQWSRYLIAIFSVLFGGFWLSQAL